MNGKRILVFVVCLLVVVALGLTLSGSGHSSNNPGAASTPSQSPSTPALRTKSGAPTETTPPPISLPSVALKGVPKQIVQQLGSFLTTYYTIEASDTQASFTDRVTRLAPPAVLSKLNLSITNLPAGTTVSPNIVWDQLQAARTIGAQHELDITLPLTVTVQLPACQPTPGQPCRYYQPYGTHSTWQYQAGSGWTMVDYQDSLGG